MIVGVGVDIVRVDRIFKVLQRRGESFARRILTPSEMAIYSQAGRPEAYLAKRFATKEAAVKAFGTGIGRISFQDITVSSSLTGQPILTFLGFAKQLCIDRKIVKSWVSISDETNLATAFVILEA